MGHAYAGHRHDRCRQETPGVPRSRSCSGRVKLLRRHRVARATIGARHDIGVGALVAWKPTEEIHTRTTDEFLVDIQIALVSRGSELIFLGTGEEMAGASGDLASATHIAEQMLKLFGKNGRSRRSVARWAPSVPSGGGPISEIDYS